MHKMLENGHRIELNRKYNFKVYVTRNALYALGHDTDFLFNGFPDVVCGIP